MSKTRKQHFVPQFYLRQFAIPERQCYADKRNCRINVFDKTDKSIQPALIRDVAQKDYFYDFPLDAFTAKHFPGGDTQVVEHELEKKEGNFAKHLVDFLKHAGTEPITDAEMRFFSDFLVLQLVRTSEFRVLLEEANTLTVSEASQKYIDEHQSVENVRAVMNYLDQNPALIQATMMLNSSEVKTAASMLLNHIWLVGVNNTDVPLYTSDNPFVRKTNVPDPSRGGGCGIGSRGIEIAFPLSPKILLMLFDRTAFYKSMHLDKTIIPLMTEDVERYNSLQVMQSHKHIFSSIDNFSLASHICQKLPSICQPNRQRIRIQEVSW